MSTHQKPKPAKILLAADGSLHALAAAQMLADLPCFEHCQLTILMVIIPRLTSFNKFVEDTLAQTRKVFGEGHANIQLIKRFYTTAAEGILEYAKKISPNLIVLGAKGLRATLGILLGGTAQQVVEYAQCPVLIVRHPYQGIRKILLLTDGSPSSLKAQEFMMQFSLPEGAVVQICHVLPPEPTLDINTLAWPMAIDVPMLPLNPIAEADMKKIAQAEYDHGVTLLEQAEVRLREQHIPTITPALLRGDAATEILRHIQEENIDLVVSGGRGLSQVQSWLLGSVSRKIVHYAPCSVLIVRGE